MPAHAVSNNVIDAKSIATSLNLKDRVEIQFTDQGILLSDIIETQQWTQTFTLQPLPDDKVMWIRFTLQNGQLANLPFTLLIGNTFIERVDVYLIDEQGRIVESVQRNYSENLVNPDAQSSFLLNFTIRSEQSLTLYLRVQDDGPATFPLELWSADAFDVQEANRFILLGALSGGLSLLATYFFITYLVRNIPSRFWFSIFSVSAMTTLLSAEGILPSLFALPGFAAEITAFALMISIFSAIKISRIIFAPLSIRWLRANYILLGAPFISLFLSNDFWQLVALLSIIIIFLSSKLIATLIFRNKMDLRSAGFYFAGWATLSLVATLEFFGFIAASSHFSGSSVLPFAFTCLGVMLIGVAIISREQSIQFNKAQKQQADIDSLTEFYKLFSHSPDGLFIANAKGELNTVNPHLSNLFGFVDSKHMLTTYKKLTDFFVDEKEADLIYGELQIQQEIVGREVKGKRLDGSEFWFSLSCRVTKKEDGNIHYGTIFDVTERRLHLINQQYLTTHDQLTGLFNRRQFLNVLNDKIKQKQDDQKFALLYIDVDQFKIINDTCGHTAGNLYIKELSHHLFDVVHKHPCFARLSADEFGLIAHFHLTSDLDLLAQKILSKVRSFEFKWDKHNFTQSVSIGICIFERESMSAEELLSNADMACVVAKESGRDKIHLYSEQTDQNANFQRELYWINQINRALKEDKFVLFYQHYRPLSATEENNCFEVLVRLEIDDQRLILPEFFMPAAERYNLSNKIDRWVIEHTFEWLNTNNEVMEGISKCNINLSGVSLSDEEFRFFLLNAFEKYQVPHRLICFEITETMAIVKMADALSFINEFKQLGCTFALDDFGTGFSSYGYLKSLPVDYVKIDGNFIRDILHDPIDFAMVTSIRDVADAMSIKTVAEFVESEEIMVQLGKMGVDYAQGYNVAEPDHLENYKPYSA